MALDDRQKQIQTQAGLEESRLNQDFVDLLRRFSTPLLLVVLLVVGGYVGFGKLRESRDGKLANALGQFEAAARAGNPGNLVRIADEFSGQAEVASLARLAAADIYLASAIKGLVPGAELTPEGRLKNADDAVSAEKRQELLKNAAASYQQVVDSTRGDPFKAVHTIGALFGLAAVAETRGEAEAAKKYFSDIVTLAESTHYIAHAEVAKARLADSDKFLSGVRLLSTDEVKSRPAPVVAPVMPPETTPDTQPLVAPFAPPEEAPAPTPVTPVVPPAPPAEAPAADPAAQPKP